MKAHASVLQSNLLFLLCVVLFFQACGSDENQASIKSNYSSVCAILARPDETGRGLHGTLLAEEREKEAVNALLAIGIKTHPVFLRYPDGHVHENVDSVKQKLLALLEDLTPEIVISFGPDGITGDRDHSSTGQAADWAFDQVASGRLLLHMAITKPLPPFYAFGVAVPRNMVDVRMKVSRYFRQRTLAVEAHQTQFNKKSRAAYKVFVHTMRKEKIMIASD